MVYNKSQQVEAQNSFGKLGNVEIKTVHSLGYSYVGKNYRHKLTFGYNAVDVMKRFRHQMGRPRVCSKNI